MKGGATPLGISGEPVRIPIALPQQPFGVVLACPSPSDAVGDGKNADMQLCKWLEAARAQDREPMHTAASTTGPSLGLSTMQRVAAAMEQCQRTLTAQHGLNQSAAAGNLVVPLLAFSPSSVTVTSISTSNTSDSTLTAPINATLSSYPLLLLSSDAPVTISAKVLTVELQRATGAAALPMHAPIPVHHFWLINPSQHGNILTSNLVQVQKSEAVTQRINRVLMVCRASAHIFEAWHQWCWAGVNE